METVHGYAGGVMAHYGEGYGWGMGPGMMGWGFGGMGWLGYVVMVAFWVLVVVGIIFVIRWAAISARHGAHEPKGDSALDILRKRYAKGEINKEEFEAKKKDIEA